MASQRDKRSAYLQALTRKRARRPRPAEIQPTSLKVNHGLEQRIIREHQDVLQIIEAALVGVAREAEEIDDRSVEQILRHSILRSPPADPEVGAAMDWLTGIRYVRKDVPDDVWRDALRVVYTSLRRHSKCTPGETSYLDFVAEFIA